MSIEFYIFSYECYCTCWCSQKVVFFTINMCRYFSAFGIHRICYYLYMYIHVRTIILYIYIYVYSYIFIYYFYCVFSTKFIHSSIIESVSFVNIRAPPTSQLVHWSAGDSQVAGPEGIACSMSCRLHSFRNESHANGSRMSGVDTAWMQHSKTG